MKNLLVYYGYLNSFNSARNQWSNDLVCDDIAHHYDMVVLGNGLEASSHPDYSNTQYIIPKLKSLNPKIEIFGYVATAQSVSGFELQVDEWDTLQVHGIFMDEAGYDYGTDRATFNTMVNYVHGKKYAKVAFPNAWNLNHILGTANDLSYPNSTYNPSLVQSNLLPSDYLLLESFGFNSVSGTYEAASETFSRGVTAKQLVLTYGGQLASVSCISNSDSNGQSEFDYLNLLAHSYGLDAYGSSDTSYGASSAAVNFWARKRLWC